MNLTLANAADSVIVVEWVVVVLYFLGRWFRHRRLVSFCLAAMAVGWLLVGLQAHRLNVDVAKSCALVLGAVLWFSIWRVERQEAERKAP